VGPGDTRDARPAQPSGGQRQVPMSDAGRIVEAGPPEKAFSDPEQERTREFLGAAL
jgi:ABC-type phosphate transport system ATPase subunit